MSSELPSACSLDATELRRRLAAIAALGHAALVSARTEPARAELVFAAAPGVRERLEAVVAAEAQCCAFLAMRIDDSAAALVLTIDAPEAAEPVLAELAGVFTQA